MTRLALVTSSIKKTNFTLTASAGVDFQEQYFSDESVKNNVSLMAGQILSWTLNRHVTLNQKIDFYPRMTDLGKFRFQEETSINIKLNDPGTIFLTFSLVDNYESRPAQDVTRNDLQITSRIALKF